MFESVVRISYLDNHPFILVYIMQKHLAKSSIFIFLDCWNITKIYFQIAGDALNAYYYLILIPLGVIGNLLSFMVSSLYLQSSIQKINLLVPIVCGFIHFQLQGPARTWEDYGQCNSLILQVMIQPNNRHMSFSAYICALAVTDTIVLLIGKNL